MAGEPVFKADAIEVADHRHGALVIDQAAHDRAGAQGQGIAQLVDPVELGGGEEGLEAVEGGADREAEIELAQVAALVHKQVGVVFGQQVVEGAHLAQQGKQVGVVEEEDMQPHLDVVAALIDPAAHLAAHERPGLVQVHLVAGIDQINRRRQTGQTRTHDGDPHPCTPLVARLYGEAGSPCGVPAIPPQATRPNRPIGKPARYSIELAYRDVP